jgi:peptidoglycan/LPS O-acetylase OafA/YrhL
MGFPQEPKLGKTFNPAGAAEWTVVPFILIGSAILASQAHPLSHQPALIQATTGIVHTLVATGAATLGSWKMLDLFNDSHKISAEVKAPINTVIAIAGVLGLFCEAASSDNFWIRAAAVAAPLAGVLAFGAPHLRFNDYSEEHRNRTL